MVRLTPAEEHPREARLRRLAAAMGLRLEKSRSRTPQALAFGTYRLIDAATNALVVQDHDAPHGYGLDLEDVEEALTERLR